MDEPLKPIIDKLVKRVVERKDHIVYHSWEDEDDPEQYGYELEFGFEDPLELQKDGSWKQVDTWKWFYRTFRFYTDDFGSQCFTGEEEETTETVPEGQRSGMVELALAEDNEIFGWLDEVAKEDW